MYFETIKTILATAIASYAQAAGKTEPEIDREIAAYIKDTSTQHQNPNPDIAYDEPLCRLGYLFVHAAANAALFERTVKASDALKQLIRDSAGQELTICAVGGGPGTELLGLSKYLSSPLRVAEGLPRRINFKILDMVSEWAETWDQLAKASEVALGQAVVEAEVAGAQVPVFSPSFLPLDVVKAESYAKYAWLFGATDVFIFNYLLSENQVHLDDFENALRVMVARAKPAAHFAIIDRLERQTDFRARVEALVTRVGLAVISNAEFNGCMEERDGPLAPYSARFGRRPRRWFQTMGQAYPTVFAIVARKP